ncbi:ABC transporter permease [uncultured Chryseobacterium sp.]|uniref:ABC transporter permease n=1 Tax=uncultured Chryseobacterium sp. TaxID=259322 RepID=UPI00261AF4A9|nr:ABC transporter permease [uncultured Chryseobacterium sp.]
MGNTAFYIARRYLIAKKGSTAVTFITWLAAFAMMTAVASMFIIVSVFSGLEDLNRDMVANLHADLTVSAKVDKKLKNPEKISDLLKKNTAVEHFSKIIEEKVYINYSDMGEIAYLRGVDSAYTSVNPINKNIFYGTYPSFKYMNEILLENSLDNRLGIPVGEGADFAMLYMPKPGTGIINKEEDIFNKKEVYVTGVFPGNDQMNNFIIAPLELAQNLLNLPKNSAYQIVIKLKNPDAADDIKDELSKNLGSDYVIKTKKEENAAFWKMINTEKLMIYLIFALVIFITTFNLAGAIIILQLDKKEQAKSLISLGLPLRNLRNTYFYTGILIVIFGIISGLIVGTLMCILQLNTGFFKAGADLPFPVKIALQNYFIVAAVALLFGLSVSWIFSKINREYILTK